MNNKNIKTKPINPAYLDSSLVIENQLVGWRWYVWAMWGNRTYAHNNHDTACNAMFFFLVLFSALAIAFFCYFPFIYLGFMVLLGINGGYILLSIQYANQSPVIIWIPVIVGVLGLSTHWQFGLGAFGYHFENYFFWAFLLGGIVAIYRRFWNAVIWKVLDKITFEYYRQHDLDFDTKTQLISDYQMAYTELCHRFCELIKSNSPKKLTPKQAQQIQIWLNNRSLHSFEQAMDLIDQHLTQSNNK